ncbi:single-stranded DNA-binding protein [Desulfoplanes sp.]
MAGSLNKAMIIGRLGKDPEIKYTQSGAAVANLSVATDESYVRDGQKVDKTEWHRVVVWNKQAEFCNNYLRKGSLVYVEGSLQTRSWEDQQGAKRYTTEIRAMRIQGMDSRNQDGGGQGGYVQAPQRTQQPPQQPAQSRPPEEDTGPVFPSEVSGMDDAPF